MQKRTFQEDWVTNAIVVRPIQGRSQIHRILIQRPLALNPHEVTMADIAPATLRAP